MPRSGPFAPETIAIPNARVIASWARSGHSDATSEAFTHWDEEGAVAPACAVCHSGVGFRMFHGLDGGEGGIPQTPVPTGGVVDCDTCHNPNLGMITEVKLPSGVMHPVKGVEGACVTCHSGRAAGTTVASATGDLPDDEVSADIGFVNPHYFTAGSTNLGSYGKIGYEYSGKTYSGRFTHAKPVATCVSCHDPHTLEIAAETCLTCHTTGKPEDIRISRVSFDGSGDTTKGIHDDVKANAAILLATIQDYATQVIGTGIIYDGAHYPYFYADANGDGVIDEADGKAVPYKSWTPRLVKAVFNWKLVNSDPGFYAHNPPYALELLYDSTEDLYTGMGKDIASLGLLR